ncbi:unnamed protein product [Trichogramma brassicae]|uniref:Uncharacterized protein n=1 Tax=Trichogramma brassicae TaxID=86971 RepID=A0A6H5J2J5_9HYME|nr:unnamed protein product [Trichogramma brassicae]
MTVHCMRQRSAAQVQIDDGGVGRRGNFSAVQGARHLTAGDVNLARRLQHICRTEVGVTSHEPIAKLCRPYLNHLASSAEPYIRSLTTILVGTKKTTTKMGHTNFLALVYFSNLRAYNEIASKAPRNFYTFYLHHGTNIPCARFRVMHRIIQQPL